MKKWKIVLATCALSSLASADWKGDMQIKLPPRGPNAPTEMTGKVQGSGASMRMDVDSPQGPMSIITNWKQHKVWNVMHSRKMYMESSMDRLGVQVPNCSGDNIDTCLATAGFKKTGTDSANGHSCAVYEKDRPGAGGETVHVKLWHPTDIKGVPLVRSTGTGSKGVVSQVDFTNVAVVSSLSPSVFTPPADYKSMAMGGKPTGAPAGQMTPEQAAALREQMLKQYGQH